jgi:acetylornithine deacetylase/succinyl-diaminopimelate desuccinylase-like protein
MIETDTSITSGSCTLLADKIEARLRAAGYGEGAITRFAVPDHPKEGGIVAVLPGTNAALKPVLLLGHIDVVTAKREDWTRNPYQFIEEGGYFYGGTADMKMLDAVAGCDDPLQARELSPARTIKLAFTCGEETSGAFNGAQWLAKNKRDLIDAEFALNEGGGHTDGKGLADGGHLADFGVQVGEKAYQDFTLVTTNPGGHSSQPVPQNALYSMARARIASAPMNSAGIQRHHPRLLQGHRAQARTRAGQGDAGAGGQPCGPRGRSHRQQGPRAALAAAHRAWPR